MSVGLMALLDDVAALVKVSAASLDDIPAQVAKTGTKVSGVVIDDAAVTPKYVVGLDPKRELSIIYRIAKKSLFNKLILLAPAALLLGYIMPWIITPILMIGGAFLCFEGYEKVHSIYAKLLGHEHAEETAAIETITPQELEDMRVAGAVRTDFILSAEIIAITYGTVADKDIINQIIVLFCVAVAITIAVYGAVGLIVKADDLGIHMAKNMRNKIANAIGRAIVTFMPHFLTVLGYIGTAAMLWVGAEIIIHGIPFLHHILEDIGNIFADQAFLSWFIKVLVSAICGIAFGAAVALLLHPLEKLYARIKPLFKKKEA